MRAWGVEMKCLICGIEIRRNDIILLVTEALYNGPCEDDVIHQIGENRIDGIIHLKCLKSPTDVVRTSNMSVPRLVDTGSVVQRSDALSLLG